MSHSRRDFLKRVSAAAAFGVLQQIPGRALWPLTPAELIPEPDEALLRELALAAVETARSAGADFADVRVSYRRGLELLGCAFEPSRSRVPTLTSRPGISWRLHYGVRASVDGAWGFAGGYVPTPEAVSRAARTAVSRAGANRPLHRRMLKLAPVARVENGEWAPPVRQDPFKVPLDDQMELAFEAVSGAEGVRGVTRSGLALRWSHRVDVFASSEGSLIVQRIPWFFPSASASGRSRDDHAVAEASVESLRRGWYGYEAVSSVDLRTEFREAAERAVAMSGPPARSSPVSVDVGRYDLVLSTQSVARLVSATLAPALNLETALGYHANRAGTSFAAPPEEILGKYQVSAPLVTLRADRTRPHSAETVRWDAEGVPTGEYTLIEDGVIVDYLTSRQTAVELAPLYEARGEAARSRACTVGGTVDAPQVSIPNLALAPGAEDLSVDDLIADTKRGFYVPRLGNGSSDQQLLSGQFTGAEVREIRDGKLGRAMKDFALQFLTLQFWKNLDAIGGPGSVVAVGNVQAVPARVREVNVLNTGRSL